MRPDVISQHAKDKPLEALTNSSESCAMSAMQNFFKFKPFVYIYKA